MAKEIYEFGEFSLDQQTRSILRNGRPAPVSPGEFDVILAMLRCPRQPVANDTIKRLAWSDKVQVTDESVRQLILSLRRKLSEDLIRNLPQRGYYLDADVRIAGHRWGRFVPAIPLALLLALALLTPGARVRDFATPPPARIFANAALRLIALPGRPDSIALSGSGQRLFATTGFGHDLMWIDTRDLSVHTLALPIVTGAVVAGPDGGAYVASPVEGVAVIGPDGQLEGVFHTGGPVTGLDVDPTTRSLILAMGNMGASRLSLRSGN